MGSSLSTSNSYASVKFRCDSNLCVGGEEFKGLVRVNAKKAFTVKSVLVEIEGVEVTRPDGNKKIEKIVVDYIPLDLPSNRGVVKAGEYMLPFYFKLPCNLPCSIPEFSVEGVKACIEYRCTAKLEMNDDDIIGDKLKLNFVQPPKPTQPVVLEQVKAIKGWFGSDKGIAEIEVIVPKTELYSGESLSLNISLNCEKCSLRIKRIKCKLYERTTIAEIKSNFDNRPTTNLKVMKHYLPGVEAKRKVTYVETIAIPTKYEDKVLESINGLYIRRNYILMLVPVFDIVGGDGLMSVETVITLSSLTVNRTAVISQEPIPYPSEPMPVQAQYDPSAMPPHATMIPQAPDLGPQIPIPPQPIVSAYVMDPIPPGEFVHADGMEVPIGQPTEWNANPPLYPSFEPPVPAPPIPGQEPLYPQL